jgi:hypothetical protein
MQQQEDMRNVEKARCTTRIPEKTFHRMLNAIGDSQSNYSSSNNAADGELMDDDQEDSELGKLSKDEEPGRVMGTISKMVEHRMESLPQKQLRFDELTQPGWGDTVDYFCERDMTSRTI